MQRTPLGIGIVGYGVFGEVSTAAYATLPDVRIVAVVDTDPARQRAATEHYLARAYDSLGDLLGDPAVDLVVLNTPPWLHGPQASAALRADKHLFVEKPLATSLEDAYQIARLAQERHMRVSIDYVMRHVPLYQLVQNLVTGHVFGGVTAFALENFASNEALYPAHWFWDRRKSGGIFVEHGVHFFDLCDQIAQSTPQRVAAFGHTLPTGQQDRVAASVRFQNHVLATFAHSFDRRAILERTTVRVAFERGLVTARGWIPEQLEITGMLHQDAYPSFAALVEIAGGQMQHTTLDTTHATVRAVVSRPDRTADYVQAIRLGMADLVEAIRDPAFTPKVTLADGIQSLAVALAAQTAIEQSATQEVPQHDPQP
jgi:predicted dehydrogenase